uniref:SNF2_N domain-containing protein n=1 Tax=Macrostomum lignano TaxID=282301 RepID=A0A1I8FE85_9PLAT
SAAFQCLIRHQALLLVPAAPPQRFPNSEVKPPEASYCLAKVETVGSADDSDEDNELSMNSGSHKPSRDNAKSKGWLRQTKKKKSAKSSDSDDELDEEDNSDDDFVSAAAKRGTRRVSDFRMSTVEDSGEKKHSKNSRKTAYKREQQQGKRVVLLDDPIRIDGEVRKVRRVAAAEAVGRFGKRRKTDKSAADREDSDEDFVEIGKKKKKTSDDERIADVNKLSSVTKEAELAEKRSQTGVAEMQRKYNENIVQEVLDDSARIRLSSLNSWCWNGIRETREPDSSEDDIVDVQEIATVKDNKMRLAHCQGFLRNGGVLIVNYDMFRNLASRTDITAEEESSRNFSSGPAGPDCSSLRRRPHPEVGHRTGLAKVMNEMRTRRRIVLTGTPLQNNLNEYYTMVNFVKPNLLGTAKEFANRFIKLYQDLPGPGGAARLSQGGISLFADNQVLYRRDAARRLKEESEEEEADFIDDEEEEDSESDSGSSSSDNSDDDKDQNKESKNKSDSGAGLYVGRGTPDRAVQTIDSLATRRLRRPPPPRRSGGTRLYNEDMANDVSISGKLYILFRHHLKMCNDIGDKLLVFSQSLLSLNVIEHFLGRFHDLTRKAMSEAFNRVDDLRLRLFLISTKAGGLGTMEEKIYDRQVTKQSLSQRVVDEHQIDRHFKADDLISCTRLMWTPSTPTPTPPPDLLAKEARWISRYTCTTRCCETSRARLLTEEERREAWREYEDERTYRPPPPPPQQQNQSGASAAAAASMAYAQQMYQQQLRMQQLAADAAAGS